ncbi:unnamed protein product, partial [marine sediment metagenome]
MKQRQTIIIAAAVIVVILLLFGSKMFFVIQPGERAVVFKKFGMGLDKENIIQPGF